LTTVAIHFVYPKKNHFKIKVLLRKDLRQFPCLRNFFEETIQLFFVTCVQLGDRLQKFFPLPIEFTFQQTESRFLRLFRIAQRCGQDRQQENRAALKERRGFHGDIQSQ
jgi:hypothetical protein